jgi:hypothetical protein
MTREREGWTWVSLSVTDEAVAILCVSQVRRARRHRQAAHS